MMFEVRVLRMADDEGALGRPDTVLYAQQFEDPDVLQRVVLVLNRAPRKRKRKAVEK